MKVFIFLVMVHTLLFANTSNVVVVKDADVSVKINGDKINLQKDTQMDLNGGDSICFLNGDGRVVIGDYKQLSKNNRVCFIVPVNKNTNIREFIKTIKDKVYVAYFDSSETVQHGSSAKGTDINVLSDVYLDKGQDLLINSDRFGPLPVEIQLFDENNILLDTYINETEAITLVRFPYTSLKSGYTFNVLNGFKQQLLQITVKVDNK